jgi:hypothetical protein
MTPQNNEPKLKETALDILVRMTCDSPFADDYYHKLKERAVKELAALREENERLKKQLEEPVLGDNIPYQNSLATIEDLKDKLTKLTEALKFYADEKTYKTERHLSIFQLPISDDLGKRARQALEGE